MEKKELETKLEMERVLQEKELLTRDKQLMSVQTELQVGKPKMKTMQEVGIV